MVRVTEHKLARVALCAALAIFAWMLMPIVSGRVSVCDDLLNYHLPIRKFYADCLANGYAFDWMPDLFAGFFLTGSGQAGTWHPWHWLLYRVFPLTTAFQLELVLSYPFMLLGMKAFLQRHIERTDAAWFGALAFTFCGFCTLRFVHPNAIAVVSHIPWLLLCLDVQLTSPSSREQVFAQTSMALLTGSQILLGYPQYVWFSLLAEGVYTGIYAAWSRRGLLQLIIIAACKLMGLGLGAVQLLPSIAALADSDRSRYSADYFLQGPLSPLDVLQWIGPYLTNSRVSGESTHELGIYIGALPIVLVIVALVSRQATTREAKLRRTMLCLAVMSLWLSFGRAGGLYVVQTWLPLVGKFRWPARTSVLTLFALATLAAIGYSALARQAIKSPQRLPSQYWLIPGVSCVVAALARMFLPPEQQGPALLIAMGPVLLVLAVVMLNEMAQGRFSAGLMLFLACDLACYGFTYEGLSRTESVATVLNPTGQPPDNQRQFRIVAETHRWSGPVRYSGNRMVLGGWKQADGYEGLMPKMHLLGESMSLDSLRILGVHWVANQGDHAQISGLVPSIDPGWLEVLNPLPRFRFASRAIIVPTAAEAAARLDADGPTVIDEAVTTEFSGPDGQETLNVLRDEPGHLQIRSNTAGNRLLVISERWARDWMAFVDDQPVKVIRAEADLMACIVPTGAHSIELRFTPTSISQGKWISGATFLALLLRLVIQGWLRKPTLQAAV
jgi:hypothetical protein